ncbi:hypothetical protein T484DRAFT_1798490 [Baffinella frigidus]|nr:hypothetical protein T484DRAFT_1798490 [Cryptophyta sp. CCMP2293]
MEVHILKTFSDPEQDPEGNTAMHYAVLYERAKVEEALIEAGAERYPANNIGETPDDTNLERLRQHAFRELRQGQSGFVLRVIGKQWIPADLREGEEWIPADLREGEEGRLLTHGRRMSLTVAGQPAE